MRRSNWIRRRRPDCRPLPLILTNYLRKRDVEAGWICLHAAKRRNGGLIDAARFMSSELKGWIVALGCPRFAWSCREARPLTWQRIKSGWEVYPRCQPPDINYLTTPPGPTSVHAKPLKSQRFPAIRTTGKAGPMLHLQKGAPLRIAHRAGGI
jgi:hypothetical protein